MAGWKGLDRVLRILCFVGRVFGTKSSQASGFLFVDSYS